MIENKKILIYLNENDLKNAGGPLGYNYNLLTGLNKNNIKNIYFIKKNKPAVNITLKLKKIKHLFIRSFLKGIRDAVRYIKLFLPCNHNSVIDLSNYDVVHFHDPIDMYNVRKSLKKYTGKVIYTTHSPILPCVEIGLGVEKWVRVLFFWLFLFEKKIDKYCFKRTDYIISPCENAMDSYSKYLKKFDEITKNKVRYLLTGCDNSEKILSKEEVESKYNISSDYFNITFLGRHNKVKGYDFLCKLGKTMANYADVRFIIGGNQGPMYDPCIKNWKEIGFTKDALSLMKYCDIYISCNLDTYFDLATIQALSVGTPVITRRVGGNLFFEKNKVPGVYLFDTIEDIVAYIEKIKAMDELEKARLKEEILKAYNEYFTIDKFSIGYYEILKKIV